MTPAARILGVVAIAVVAIGAGAVGGHAAPLPVTLDPGITRGPVNLHGTTRLAVATTPPASFRASLDPVPQDARLLTAIAVAEGATAIRFRIAFEGDGASTPLYDRVLDAADGRDRRWVDVGVSLAALAGRHGTLLFETTPAGAGATPVPAGLWAPPDIAICTGDAPSLLLVTIDALRADHLGSAGYPRPTTPHLDAFAADATRFTRAFAGGPKTIPSIPQILTGTWFYWHRSVSGLSDLLGTTGMPSHAIVNNPYVAGWLRGEQPSFDAVRAGDELDARAITSAALRHLTAAGRCPTTLYLHYLDPHTPYHAPPRWARRFVDRSATTTIGLTWSDVSRAWQDAYGDADRQRIVDLYDGSLAYTDRQLGRLLRGLVRRGRLDRTLVIVTADHGEELWDHKKFFHGQSLYDELLHVPLLVRLPGVGHGRVVEDVVRTVDLVPTIAETFGRPAPVGDGRSLRALAAGTPDDAARVAFALVSHAEPRTPERQAVRTATKKLIRDVSDGAVQVYDLVADPKEKRNLGPAAPGTADLQRALDQVRAQLDGKGYQLRLDGLADRPVRYVVDVASDPPIPLIALDRLSLEPGDLFDFKPRASAFTVMGTLTPGDEDHLRFDAFAAAGVLKITLRLDGSPAPDGTVRLGSGATPSGAVVDLADPKLDGAPPARSPSAAIDGVTVALWRASAVAKARPPSTLDDATRERLRQLGYVE